MLKTFQVISFKGLPQADATSVEMPSKTQKPALDKIIKDSVEIQKQTDKPISFLAKIIQYGSFKLPFYPMILLGLYSAGKKVKDLITGSKNFNLMKEGKRIGIAFALAIPFLFLTDVINKKTEQKHFENAKKIIDDYNQKNKTDLRIENSPLHLSKWIATAAFFHPDAGKIVLSNRICSDWFAALLQKYTLAHELEHTRQYTLIAGSKDGIKKLNFIQAKTSARQLSEEQKKEIYNAYQEIKNGVGEDYKNTKINIDFAEYNIIDYVTAMYKILYEKNTTQDDIPIIINKEFYEKANAQRGPLSEEEEKKAQVYLEANAKYPDKLSIIDALNPRSDYHQNILEKEAYAVMPWYAKI